MRFVCIRKCRKSLKITVVGTKNKFWEIQSINCWLMKQSLSVVFYPINESGIKKASDTRRKERFRSMTQTKPQFLFVSEDPWQFQLKKL